MRVAGAEALCEWEWKGEGPQEGGAEEVRGPESQSESSEEELVFLQLQREEGRGGKDGNE